MSSNDALKQLLQVLKDTVEPEQLKKVLINLQDLQKKSKAPKKTDVMECIVNVVGAESYKAAVLQVKNKIEKSKVDPTKQALNLDRYEELMQQAKARYANANKEEAVVGAQTDAYEKAKQQALAHLEARAKQEAQDKGEFVFSGTSTFNLDVASAAPLATSGVSGTNSKGKAKAKPKGKAKAKGKAKGKSIASTGSAAAASTTAESVFSFNADTTDSTDAAADKLGSLSIGSESTPFSFGAPTEGASFSFGSPAPAPAPAPPAE